jgi:hypothetical protein
MMCQVKCPKRTLTVFFTLLSVCLSAQQFHAVKVENSGSRTPLVVQKGVSTLQLEGLTPGEFYLVKAVPAGEAQKTELGLLPAFSDISYGTSQKDEYGVIRFKAPGTTASFRLSAVAKEVLTDIPVFISVSAESGQWHSNGSSSGQESAAALQVTPGVSAQSLIANTLVGGDCFSVSNITASGNIMSRGTFSNGASNIGIGSGMVMSTGSVSILAGPNSSNSTNGGFNVLASDPDLRTLIPTYDLYDANVIEFDFTPTANTVTFDFLFGSEEYCEYVGTQFNDVFGFFVTGPGISGVANLAVIPNTTTPVTTNNVNHVLNSQYYFNNNYNVISCGLAVTDPVIFQEAELDGWTTPLQAKLSVQPCQTYHIKLAIADVSDWLFDSAVFLKANSFNAGGQVSASPVYKPGLQLAHEGCPGAGIRFTRGNSDISQPLTVTYTVAPSSTAISGIDYTPLPSSLVFQPGQSEIFIPVTVFSDGLTEGQETIELLISNSCQCQQTAVTFLINDLEPLLLSVTGDTTVCEISPASITALAGGGESPYSYKWSNGATTAGITVAPSSTTIYSVTVTDNCGETNSAQTMVTVIPLERKTLQVPLCFGESVEINGQFYSGTVTFIDTTYTGTPCGAITTYKLTELPEIKTFRTITFCPGDTVDVGGVQYTEEGVKFLMFTASNGCDSTVVYTLQYAVPSPSVVGITCPASVSVFTNNGAGAEIQYAYPAATTTCVCPGLEIEMINGLPSGSIFPQGVTKVCYRAEDACGQTKTCCFNVSVLEDAPCDVKVIGCLRYELLTITEDPGGNKTYRVQVTNYCPDPLIYTAIQVPSGVLAMKPLDNTIYTAPSGNQYLVRNPNFAPFYSVRYRALNPGIANGQSEIFRYTLPAQTDVLFFEVISRLSIQQFFAAHMNTFYCPIGVTPPDNRDDEGGIYQSFVPGAVPNPTTGAFRMILESEEDTPVEYRVFNSQGQLVLSDRGELYAGQADITLPESLPNGLYFVEIVGFDDLGGMQRVVLQR